MRHAFFLLVLIQLLGGLTTAGGNERPNIVWVMIDDMSPHFRCYGENAIETPNVDRLASRGTRFAKAFTTAPICSISRSALVTGCYQTSIGCQNHRSGSKQFPIELAAGMSTVPALMRQAGYHTSNLSFDAFMKEGGTVAVAKTDYNFVWDAAQTYDTTHWSDRKPGQPFFTQVQLHGGKHRGQKPTEAWPRKVQQTLGSVTPTSIVRLTADLPDDNVIVSDWAQYLDTVRYTDWEVGRIIERLKAAGVHEKTVVVLWADHGISHVRHKQFLYDGGLHIPLILSGPGIQQSVVRKDMVEHIDIAAVTLGLAGLVKPDWMQAQDFLADTYQPRKYVYAARDRADETVDRIRSVRSERFKYIRNYFPTRPYLQPNRYKDDKAIVQAMRRLNSEHRLTAEQALIMAETRPREELYDLDSDPLELKNLATEANYANVRDELRQALRRWIQQTDDRGREVESQEVYMNYVMDARPEGGRNQQNDVFTKNVEMMLRWSVERPMDREEQ